MVASPVVVSTQHLGISFPGKKGDFWAIRGVDLEIRKQEFVCVVGPSGFGKTTLLRALSGLLQPTEGEINFNYQMSKPTLGIVFQHSSLLPWRSVLANITLPLELKGIPKETAKRKAQDWIELIGLQGFTNHWPREISGGMAQRVALARALILDPDLLLMDEPFGSLDALTREKMSSELLNLWQTRRKTVIMVTHSISEAILLSDRVLVLSGKPGRIVAEFNVDLARPRNDTVRYSQRFGALAGQIKSALDENPTVD